MSEKQVNGTTLIEAIVETAKVIGIGRNNRSVVVLTQGGEKTSFPMDRCRFIGILKDATEHPCFLDRRSGLVPKVNELVVFARKSKRNGFVWGHNRFWDNAEESLRNTPNGHRNGNGRSGLHDLGLKF